MDKGALLMLLCLQAFLLITSLPSSEAAALLREDLTPPGRRVKPPHKHEGPNHSYRRLAALGKHTYKKNVDLASLQ
ncbi:hypothetical protein F7725_011256 [Dissostichus mawsoni]|uniref:Uncharacterized protein n=1 Tax=Dissostichus mawsoni TaxID=36200 RepID=A0A7J5Z8I2_DISMA|nr:hypothetical protein F7725_011256 [Dissostichus mawsoni]